jgi:hypothetical protein
MLVALTAMSTEPPPGNGEATESPTDRPEDETDPYTIDSNAWLLWGRATRSNNVITFHKSVVMADIVRPERPVYYYLDTVQEQVLFSRNDDPWAGDERFEYVASRQVDVQHVAKIPPRFFEDYNEYGSEEVNVEMRVDEPYLLEYEHLYYPVSPNKCFAIDCAAYLVPVEDVVDIWDPFIAQKRTDEDVRDYGIDVPNMDPGIGGKTA